MLEDELLIAMDVEQTCLDHGADMVTIMRSLEDLGENPFGDHQFDCAILDLRLGGSSTICFAEQLRARLVPFVFATGLSDASEITRKFPDVAIASKPYSGEDLIGMLIAAIDGAGLSRSA